MNARPLRLAALVAGLVLAAGCTATAPPAPVGASSTPSATPGLGSDPISDYYRFTKSTVTVKVPDIATQVEITAIGGRGGDSGGKASFGTIRPGGNGTSVTASWSVQKGQVLTLTVGGGGSRQTAGWGGGSGNGGSGGCSNGGGGGGASFVTLDGQTIVIAGGGGGGGYYGASAVTDQGGKGGANAGGDAGAGPKHGSGGGIGSASSVAAGANGGNGKNLGGCAGGGGGGAGGGGGGVGGSTGGGGGGGGGAGGSWSTGSIDRATYSTDNPSGITDGYIMLTFTPQNHN